ncbi:hypothetical protein TNCV_3582071 [Trichonephila clavipes]|nr:hypothetical protein TNCV_3582071 [Trichonephila clavipes]
MNLYTNAELADVHIQLAYGNERAAFWFCVERYPTNRIIKHSLDCIRTQWKINLSGPLLKVLGGRKQHVNSYIRRGHVACCGSKSRYQCTGSCRCNRKILSNRQSCTAE